MKKPEHRKPATKAQAVKKGQAYMCRFCGYVYDPAEHHGVEFADLPANWVCPLCGVGKSDFEPIQ